MPALELPLSRTRRLFCTWLTPEQLSQQSSAARRALRDVLGLTAPEMHEVFKKWNETELDSYLVEITRDILAFMARFSVVVPW